MNARNNENKIKQSILSEPDVRFDAEMEVDFTQNIHVTISNTVAGY